MAASAAKAKKNNAPSKKQGSSGKIATQGEGLPKIGAVAKHH